MIIIALVIIAAAGSAVWHISHGVDSDVVQQRSDQRFVEGFEQGRQVQMDRQIEGINQGTYIPEDLPSADLQVENGPPEELPESLQIEIHIELEEEEEGETNGLKIDPKKIDDNINIQGEAVVQAGERSRSKRGGSVTFYRNKNGGSTYWAGDPEDDPWADDGDWKETD